MERLMTPLKSGTKAYLTQQVVPALTEGLTRLGIARPEDPFLFLARFMFELSPNKADHVLLSRAELQVMVREQALATVEGSRKGADSFADAPAGPAGSAFRAAKALSGPTSIANNEAPAQREPDAEPETELGPESMSEPVEQRQQDLKGYHAEDYAEDAADAASSRSSAPSARSTASEMETTARSELPISAAAFGDAGEEPNSEEAVTVGVGAELGSEEAVSSGPESTLGDEVCDDKTASPAADAGESASGAELDNASDDVRGGAELDNASNGVGGGAGLADSGAAQPEGESGGDFVDLAGATEVRCGLRIGTKMLLARAYLGEAQGTFLILATDPRTMELYRFECEGIVYAQLRQDGAGDLQVVKSVVAALGFVRDESTGVMILGVP